MSELKWTSEKPKEPEMYLWRANKHHSKRAYNILTRNGKLIVHELNCFLTDIKHGQWSGPIPEPTEPAQPHYIDKAVEHDLNQRIKND